MSTAGPEATLAKFARFVSRQMALYFPDDRLSELRHKLVPLATEAGFDDLDKYLQSLMGAPLSRPRLETLARALTIGETYFLRDPRSYQVLEQEVLAELVAQRRQNDRSLRIWSAGCSSGEEPYTLAILLSRAIPDLDSWDISLVATDINPAALERGRHGIYSKWSFRNAPAWLMEYFTRRPDGRYQIVPRIKCMVRFEYLNLAQDVADAVPVAGTDDVDIIFCRNVMLYFEPAQIERTMLRFHDALHTGGWLFVGPTEVDPSLLTGFTCRRHDGAFVLGKGVPDTTPAAPLPQPDLAPARHSTPAAQPAKLAAAATGAPPAPGEPPAAAPEGPTGGTAVDAAFGEAQACYRAGKYRDAAACVRHALETGPQPVDILVLGARALANIGDFIEARELCEHAIAADRLSAQGHYLYSIILEHLGEFEAAAAALKNVLFIDHDHLLAYFALGNLARQSGDAAETERNFANALRLLERRDPCETIPESEGLTAGGLAQMIRDMTQGRSVHGRG